ncbi:MAG: HEAT repeat domain-containing protein, partial [Myxococcota bacterium]|nr:HEAT repeat domain-containing protein [Myxococcota bacterium]
MIDRPSLGIALGALVAVAIGAAASGADAWAERFEVERRARELTSSDRAVRRDAAERLGMVGEHERAVDALTEALGSEVDAEVRTAIADALARRRDPRAIE